MEETWELDVSGVASTDGATPINQITPAESLLCQRFAIAHEPVELL